MPPAFAIVTKGMIKSSICIYVLWLRNLNHCFCQVTFVGYSQQKRTIRSLLVFLTSSPIHLNDHDKWIKITELQLHYLCPESQSSNPLDLILHIVTWRQTNLELTITLLGFGLSFSIWWFLSNALFLDWSWKHYDSSSCQLSHCYIQANQCALACWKGLSTWTHPKHLMKDKTASALAS